MGTCYTCAYCYQTDHYFINKYACKLYDIYVRADDSCENYITRPSGGSGCFLTSACVDFLGKADDCEELTTLRRFRDTYMQNTDEGRALVDEYYKIAPSIVDKINLSKDRAQHYTYIYSVIQTCIHMIENEKYDNAMNEYKNMVITLKEKFA